MYSSSGSQLSGFTCLSCGVTFLDVEHQREHHKSEWHKYNLKRKVVELPPVTQDVFHQIEANNIKMIDNTEDGDDCESFGSVDEDQPSGVAIPSNECLFCNMKSTNLEDNLKHMSLSHSFLIPDIEFVTDLEGLVSYLDEKVGLGFECLWCSENGKRFRSALSAKQHMESKGHSKIRHESGETLLEYAHYYDYSSSYPVADPDGHDIDQDQDEDVLPQIIEHDNYELKLSSGAVIGHRDLSRYYRQNLKPHNPHESRSLSTRSSLLNKVMTQYRALGWTGTVGEAAALKAKDIQYVQTLDKKRYMKIGIKHNSVLQDHFNPR